MTSWAETTQRNNPSMNTTILNHNKNLYSIIPHTHFYEIVALYIINISIHLTTGINNQKGIQVLTIKKSQVL